VARKTIEDMLAESRRRLRRLEPREADHAVRRGAVLVDTRSPDEALETGRVPGSINIPLSVLEWRLDPDSPWREPAVGGLESELILLCAHGYSSSLAAWRLQQLGFTNVTDVVGGFERWRSEGLPVDRV
jgi:rhodanese-related sulfurtransferase